MIDSQMMFKLGGQNVWDKVAFDYVIIHQSKVGEYKELGWFLTRQEAIANGTPAPAPEPIEDPTPAPEPESEFEDPKPRRKLRYKDLTEAEAAEIKADQDTVYNLAQKYNATYHCIRKAKGKI